MDARSHVMLVDDNDADNVFHEVILRAAGFVGRLSVHETGPFALAALTGDTDDPPALILLDINMPGMDGFQFLQAYQELQRNAQARAIVVMLTSSPDPRDRQQAESFACVRGYVVKPINLAAAQRLSELLDAPPPNQ